MSFNVSEEEFMYKYELYSKELFKIAYGYTRSKQDSEDIIQNTFMKYLNIKKQFKTINDEKYWLIRVTINESLDLLKSYYIKNIVLNNEIVMNTPKDIELTENQKKNEEMILCINCLPIKYKSIITLFYYNDLSVKEISRIINISESAVKKRLERARCVLKNKMEEKLNEKR